MIHCGLLHHNFKDVPNEPFNCQKHNESATTTKPPGSDTKSKTFFAHRLMAMPKLSMELAIPTAKPRFPCSAAASYKTEVHIPVDLDLLPALLTCR